MYKSGVKNKHHTGTGNSSLSKLLFSIEVDRVLFFFFFWSISVWATSVCHAIFLLIGMHSCAVNVSWTKEWLTLGMCTARFRMAAVCWQHSTWWGGEKEKQAAIQSRHMTWYIAFGSLWCCGSALGSAQAKNWSACEWIAPVKPRRENSYLCKHHFVALEGTGKAFYFFQKTAPKCAMCLRVFFLVVFSWLC